MNARHIMDSPEVTRYGFLIFPNYSMMGLVSAIEPLRVANRLHGSTLYEWDIITHDGKPSKASNGIDVMPTAFMEDEPNFTILFICTGLDYESFNDPATFAWLRKRARYGHAFGAISSGTYVAARAGLMNGYRCTIHWENAIGFREQFPNVELTGAVFEIDRNRYTCAGGTSAMDLILHLIAEHHGHTLAAEISTQFMHDRIRNNTDQQLMSRHILLASKSEKLMSAVNIMMENLEEPVQLRDIADQVGVTMRQVERLFHRYVNMTPVKYYMDLRLEHARLLLLQTGIPVLEVAMASGFISHSHFSKCYRNHYGCSPVQERNRQL